MSTIQGIYVHGKHSKREPITLTINSSGEIINEKKGIHVSINKVVISPRIADTTRFLTLPNGNHIETTDNDPIDSAISNFGQKHIGHESRTHFIIYPAVLLIVVMFSWIFLHFAVPASADTVAHKIPTEVVVEHGEAAYKDIKEVHLTPTTISESRLNELEKLFQSVIPDQETATTKYPYKLHVLNSETLGVNAFAFPSGDIVLTDGLVKLAEDDDEIKSVLLHEIAHVEKRHAMRALVQTSTLFIIAVTVSGDLASLSTLLVGLPAILLNSNYSREMESEADIYAVEKLREIGISKQKFIDILSRINEMKVEESKTEDNKNNRGYLDSHPHIEERIAKLP